MEMAGKGMLFLVGAMDTIGVVFPSELVVFRLDFSRRRMALESKCSVRIGWEDGPRLHQSGGRAGGLMLGEDAVDKDSSILDEQTRVRLSSECVHVDLPHAANRARRYRKQA